MKNKIYLLFILLIANLGMAQTKVSGIVVDNTNQPIPFANVIFKNSTKGSVTNEDGRFYIESQQNYAAIEVSFVGFETRVIALPKAVNYNFIVKLMV